MSIMGTAISGLLAYQRALATTGHNIANASTEGYTRQRVEFSAQNPQRLGGHYIGQGVQITDVRRIQNDLVDTQLRGALSNNSYGETLAGYAERIDELLADDTTGLEPVLESYFNAVQDVASDPTSISARTVLLNEAESLAERFKSLNSQLEEQRTLVNGQIATAVDEVNQYAESIASLNQQIVSGYSAGSAPNDLLDQRDQLLSKLSEKIDVNITTQDDGAVNVFIGNGQSLVMAGVSNKLVADHLSGDAENLDIGLVSRSGGTPINVNRFMSGGEIGGLLETRTGFLDTAQNELGLIGLNLATRFNEQNALGLDLNDQLGGDIFKLPAVSVSHPNTNSIGASPSVTISDVTDLTASDYRLRFDGTSYSLTRQPGNESVTLSADPSDPTNTDLMVGDGLRIDTSALTAAGAAAGDSWLIQPTRFASSGLEVAMTDPAKIAAAGAVKAEVSDLNTGSGTVESARAVDADNPNLFARAVITADGAGGYTVSIPPPAASDTPTVSVQDGITTISANGWEVTLKGTPAAGDQFVVGSNAGQDGDNGNMLLMAGIQNERLVEGHETLQGTYTSILAEVGTETRQAQIARDSSATLLESAQAQREEISGVSLDEEAANLLRFQQAYQAAAQVISTTSAMFDTLINAVR